MKNLSNNTYQLKISVLLFFAFIALNVCYSATYYIDSINGDDNNNGTTQESPWKTLSQVNKTEFKPGDRIIFKANGIWVGQLWPKGSGIKGTPILIDMYGSGNKPIINGLGEVVNTIYLHNQQYWEINNLEITNYKGGDNSLKRGVYVVAENYGTLHHIHLKNLYIHSVNGDMSTKHNGGIFFEVLGKSKKTKFDDFLIEGCQIFDVDRTGISNYSTWKDRTLNENGEWYPSTNIVIRNNWIENAGANGLIIRVAKKPIIEHNVFKRCSLKGSGNASFPFNCDDALFQYNESYLTVFNPGDADAGGYDSDWRCKRSVFQYNYSHDNDYGFILICCNGNLGFNDGTIIRYNISQNDNGHIFRTSGPATNTTIYNNTIYINSKMKNVKYDRKDNAIPKICYHKSWNGYSDGTFYYNNVFYNLSEKAYYDFGKSTNNVFDYNVFYGIHPESEPEDPHKLTDDPLFVEPGTGKIGLTTLDGYKLKDGSPCINSGKKINNNGGRDFWGNKLYKSAPDRGAHETDRFVKNTSSAYVVGHPELPRVLIIGNSISIGYTPFVCEALEGKMNIHRIPENGSHTWIGLEKLDEWLGDKPWDVIHFNWGLHDLKYLKNGKYDITGTQVSTLEQYEENLMALVRQLKTTGAKLIWASTTPIPDSSGGRMMGDEIHYNRTAEKIMEQHGVLINDLHSWIKPHLAQYQRQHNVHFTPEGYQFLGSRVVDKIRDILK